MKLRLFAASLGAVLALLWGGPAMAGSNNSGGGQVTMPALYDCEPFLINFAVLPQDAANKILADPAQQFNTIYMFPDCEGAPMVLDAITGVAKEPVPRSGFNPLWRVVMVTGGCPSLNPDVLCSDDKITSSTAVTLTTTNTLVRCSVIGGPSK